MGECKFSFICTRAWDDLAPIDGEWLVRFCNQCSEQVTLAQPNEEARALAAAGKCAALPSILANPSKPIGQIVIGRLASDFGYGRHS